MKKINLFVLFCGLSVASFAQFIKCEDIPLNYLEQQIVFNGNTFFADSALQIPIVNNSDKGYAYPLAKLMNLTPLPEGMSFHVNSKNWEVFASAYNPGDTMPVYFHFYVTKAIPENFTVHFKLYASNLSPLEIDSCYFESDFYLNLNPSIPSRVENFSDSKSLSLYPNPVSDFLHITVSEFSSEENFEIFDSKGMLKVKGVLSDENKINVQGFSAGLYFIKTATPSMHSRFIVP
jgi:hypothetical protein